MGIGQTLHIEGVGRRFAALAALHDVTLHVPPGAMIAIIGPSGAGKSTLLRVINRLVEPTAGRVLYGTTDVTALSGRAVARWRATCAMVFQQFNLSPRLDALTNVLMGGLQRQPAWRTLTGLFPHEERLRAMQLLDEFGVAERAFIRAERLSGGQQQRVALARALMQSPELILADEPTASLDPRNARQVMEALAAINRTRQISVICNLHNVAFAREYCQRIVGLRAGEIVFDGLPADLTREIAADLYAGDAEADEAPADLRVLQPA